MTRCESEIYYLIVWGKLSFIEYALYLFYLETNFIVKLRNKIML